MVRNTARAVALGAKLRSAREAAGLSLRALAKQVEIDHSVLSRYESGERTPNSAEIAVFVTTLGLTGSERDEIVALAGNTSGSPWMATDMPEQQAQLAALLDAEQMAQRIVSWSPLIIPGLLQESSYTRTIMRRSHVPDSEIQMRTAIRMGRRDVLTRKNPTHFTALLGESALRQRIGSTTVMVGQLEHLLSMSALPTIEIFVVPTETDWHPGLYGPFLLLALNDNKSIVHLEHAPTSLFVQDEPSVAIFQEAIHEMTKVALSSAESADLITRELVRWKRGG